MPKFAVVTGASSGIGAEFARQLSARGYNLMLVARRADRLQALSNSLTTECEIFTADLAHKSECLRLADALADRRIDLFINNAGFGDCGSPPGAFAPAGLLIYTLNRKLTMSPSFMTYSLPSLRTRPLALAAAMVPQAFMSSKAMTSARMKPRSKSVWILPAA